MTDFIRALRKETGQGAAADAFIPLAFELSEACQFDWSEERLGLRLVVCLKAESAMRLLKARSERPFDGAEDLAKRAEIEQQDMTLLAAADARMSVPGHRRQQVWKAAGQR